MLALAGPPGWPTGPTGVAGGAMLGWDEGISTKAAACVFVSEGFKEGRYNSGGM